MLHFNDPSHTLDQQFDDYLKDKSVVIVGRGEYLPTLEQGDYIDSFDIVVRIHRPLPYTSQFESGDPEDFALTPKSFLPSLGSRTNVFYLQYFLAKDSITRYLNEFREAGGAFICYDDSARGRQGETAPLRKLVPVRYASPELWHYLHCTLGSYPHGGTLAIADVLMRDVKCAYLTGFPCHITKENTKGSQDFGHKSVNDFHYLRSIVAEHENLTADAVMTDYFEKFANLPVPPPQSTT